jgi:hypothetical protein
MDDETGTPESPNVFRGHLDECVEHLSRCITSNAKKHLDVVELRQPIADFCKVRPNTVKNWLDGGSVVGQSRVRLICFLSTLGYYVLELERLGYIKPLTEALGYGVMSFEDAMSELKYGSMQHLLSAVLGKDGMHPERQTLVWKIAKEKKLELATAKEACHRKFRPQFPLAEAIRQRKASAISSLADALLILLETPEISAPFWTNIQNLSTEERRTFLQLSGELADLSVKLAQSQDKEACDG